MKTKDNSTSYLHKKMDDWDSYIDRLREITELCQAGVGAWEDIESGQDLA